MYTVYIRPPKGVEPRHIHEERRIRELATAISRYAEDSASIPTEWVEEYNELVARRRAIK